MANMQDTASRLAEQPGSSDPATHSAKGVPFLPSFATFGWRVVSLHVMTYFIMGLAALVFIDYRQLFENTELRHLMVPISSPWVAAGPALQVFRGVLFALVLYPLASEFIRRKNGTLILWSLFVGLAILGTAGPSPGSLEGMLYTKVEFIHHLRGLPEVLLQTLLFSFGLTAWCRKPARWKNIVSGVAVGLIVLMSLLGALAAMGMLPAA